MKAKNNQLNEINSLIGRLKTRSSKLRTLLRPSQPAITCSKFTIETLEQGVQYVQS